MKKIFVNLLTLAVIFSLFANILLVSSKAINTMANTSITYSVAEVQAISTNKVAVSFMVRANYIAEEIGASSIALYSSNGQLINSSASSSMRKYDSLFYDDHTSFSVPSKGSYYAKVTLFATINGVTDRKTMTTNTIAIS